MSNLRFGWARALAREPYVNRSASAPSGRAIAGDELYSGHDDTSGREDLKKIRGRVRELTDEDWQNRRLALQRGGRDPWSKARFKRDSVHTRLYRGACIFHNRLDHPGGAGCALH